MDNSDIPKISLTYTITPANGLFTMKQYPTKEQDPLESLVKFKETQGFPEVAALLTMLKI
jgi:hypothetical protein